jgi:DNA-binding GntR family transcriptional regulator
MRPRKSTVVDQVVLSLSQAMFEGRLSPGSTLREEQISQRFSVSRSTVREAIRVLTMDGLVMRQPNRSVVVRHLTVAEVEDIFRARLVLESACVRAVITCPDRTLEELLWNFQVYEAAVISSDPSVAAEAHVAFHAGMVRTLSGSLWLAETERSMLRQLHLLQGTVRLSGWELQEEIRVHRELCECCAARKIEAAMVNLEKGLEASRALAIRFSLEALELAKSRGELSLPCPPV